MAEGGALLRRYTAYTRIEGSNPSLSAKIRGNPLRLNNIIHQDQRLPTLLPTLDDQIGGSLQGARASSNVLG